MDCSMLNAKRLGAAVRLESLPMLWTALLLYQAAIYEFPRRRENLLVGTHGSLQLNLTSVN